MYFQIRRHRPKDPRWDRPVGKCTTPLNVFALLFSANRALAKLSTIVDPWAEISEEDAMKARKVIDETLCMRAEECFGEGKGGGEEWDDTITSGGSRFDDAGYGEG